MICRVDPRALRINSGRLLKCKIFALLFFGLNLIAAGHAYAQAVGMQIEDPPPVELAERLSSLMHEVRPSDANASLNAIKILDGPLWREYNVLFLRVEADCQSDLCMTIIGRVSERRIMPELILRAKSSIILSDYGVMLWGSSIASFPILFEGNDNSATVVWERDGKWIVGSCGNCFTLTQPATKRSPLQQPQSLPTPTFEEFRRSLALDP